MHERTPRQSHRRVLFVGLLAIVLGALIAPLSGYLYVAMAAPPASQAAGPEVHDSATWQRENPRSRYWRQVREGNAGYSAVTSGQDANVLMNVSGQDWRRIRNGYVSTYGPFFLLAVVLVLGLFYVFKGPVKLGRERSGRTVARWTANERVLHWVTAVLFVIMAIGGLSLLFGRAVLRPLLGGAGFAAWASVSKVVHNYTGVLFTACILLMIVVWMQANWPRREDWMWFRRGGGMLGKHAPAGFVNAGEKGWFWFIAIAGLLVCITGLVLDFPNFGGSRLTMQTANIIHSVLAIVWVGIFFGHVYVGTIGMEGSLEGMTRGEVSVEWAKQHHDLWYQEVTSGRREEGNAGKAVDPAVPGA